MSYQTAFPKPGNFRLPTFYDVFASFSQTEYINVGLKWNVAESKAAMAYATRLSSGHSPIAEKTDDYHIEAFSKADKPKANDYTKIRFRQKDAYSGSVGYAAPDSQQPGLFLFWDNKKKDYAKLQAGDLLLMKNADITGALKVKGAINSLEKIVTTKDSEFAGTTVGTTAIGSKLEAPEARGIGLYTRPKGGSIDINKPHLFVDAEGKIGVGSIKPIAQMHLKSAETALHVEEGRISIGGKSVVEVDGEVQGKPAAGQRFIVTPSGNIGVNTRDPQEKLDVAGSFKVDSGAVQGPSKATLFVTNSLQKCNEHSLRVRDHFYVAACGKVGVKTPEPLADFHVTGKSKTDFLDVDKDVAIAGTLQTAKFAPLKSHFEADTLKIMKNSQLVGKVQMDNDVVIKGNLFVEKEVKMIGGGPDEMTQMMESRLALIEESHKSLQEWHKSLLDSHDKLKQHNHALQDRVDKLESQLTESR